MIRANRSHLTIYCFNVFICVDEADLVNGYLQETHLDWIPGMNNVRLKDMSSFIRTTDPNDFQLNYALDASSTCYNATSNTFNTFHDYEPSVLETLSSLIPSVYAIGPIDLLYKHMIQDKPSTIESIGCNHSKNDYTCLEWLDTKSPGSVVAIYVEYLYLMTGQQVSAYAWGLCANNKDFLWIGNSDFVRVQGTLHCCLKRSWRRRKPGVCLLIGARQSMFLNIQPSVDCLQIAITS